MLVAVRYAFKKGMSEHKAANNFMTFTTDNTLLKHIGPRQ